MPFEGFLPYEKYEHVSAATPRSKEEQDLIDQITEQLAIFETRFRDEPPKDPRALGDLIFEIKDLKAKRDVLLGTEDAEFDETKHAREDAA